MTRTQRTLQKLSIEDVAEFVQTSLQQKDSICSGIYILICLHRVES